MRLIFEGTGNGTGEKGPVSRSSASAPATGLAAEPARGSASALEPSLLSGAPSSPPTLKDHEARSFYSQSQKSASELSSYSANETGSVVDFATLVEREARLQALITDLEVCLCRIRCR